MARYGYNSITLEDSLVSRIDDLINSGNENLKSRPKVIATAIMELEKNRDRKVK